MWTRFAVSFEWQSCSPFVSPIFPPDANHAPAPRSWRDSGYPAFAQWVIGRSTRQIRTTAPGVGRGGGSVIAGSRDRRLALATAGHPHGDPGHRRGRSGAVTTRSRRSSSRDRLIGLFTSFYHRATYQASAKTPHLSADFVSPCFIPPSGGSVRATRNP